MDKCELCSREFATRQGLVGHQRFKHPPDSSSSPGPTPGDQVVTQRVLKEVSADINAALDRHQGILMSIDETVVQSLEEPELIRAMIHQEFEDHLASRQLIRDEYGREFLGMPGVHDALEFYQRSKERNQKYPDQQVVENWCDVPGVKEIIDEYRVRNILIEVPTVPKGLDDTQIQSTIPTVPKGLGTDHAITVEELTAAIDYENARIALLNQQRDVRTGE